MKRLVVLMAFVMVLMGAWALAPGQAALAAQAAQVALAAQAVPLSGLQLQELLVGKVTLTAACVIAEQESVAIPAGVSLDTAGFGLQVNGTLRNEGTLTIGTGGVSVGGLLDNAGILQADGTFTVRPMGVVANSGDFASVRLNNNGKMTNSGVMSVGTLKNDINGVISSLGALTAESVTNARTIYSVTVLNDLPGTVFDAGSGRFGGEVKLYAYSATQPSFPYGLVSAPAGYRLRGWLDNTGVTQYATGVYTNDLGPYMAVFMPTPATVGALETTDSATRYRHALNITGFPENGILELDKTYRLTSNLPLLAKDIHSGPEFKVKVIDGRQFDMTPLETGEQAISLQVDGQRLTLGFFIKSKTGKTLPDLRDTVRAGVDAAGAGAVGVMSAQEGGTQGQVSRPVGAFAKAPAGRVPDAVVQIGGASLWVIDGVVYAP